MRLTLRFAVFVVIHSPTPTQNSIDAQTSLSIGKLVCVEELKSVDVMARFRMDGGRCQPANTSGDRFRHLRCMLTASQGFPLKTVAAGRRGAPSARLTSRPEPLALRVSWYGSHTPPQAISGLGVSVKCRVLMFGLLSKIRLIVGLTLLVY